MSRRTALIFGVSGQDGAYLTHLLLAKGYDVHGVSRDIGHASFDRLSRLGIRDRVTLHSATLTDFRAIADLLDRVGPNEIYNLSGQSSVGSSFDMPVETFQSVAVGSINLLECLRLSKGAARLFQAESSECFGDTQEPVSEESAFRPRSPYAVAKAASYWTNALYREAYGVHVCSGIVSNHESPLRGERFVTRKLVREAVKIARGGKQKLTLGNILIARDWGWAPEYVEAMWRILQRNEADDFVIATGETHRLCDLAGEIFGALGLNWQDHVQIDKTLFRPSEIPQTKLDPRRIESRVGWAARSKMKQIAEYLVRCELERKLGPVPWTADELADRGHVEKKNTPVEGLFDHAVPAP